MGARSQCCSLPQQNCRSGPLSSYLSVRMKLIVVESPTKIKSYNKALGSEYKVVASKGHCIDLPEKKLSVNIRKDFEPTFSIVDGKEDVVQSIKSLAKKSSDVYLMTDEDREGTAIAWHLSNELCGQTKAKIHRASTNEITKQGIRNAIQNAGEIDTLMVDAYLARRIMDRLCGYKTSFLTQQATGGRSAGRVQSAFLRIICDREKEILAFVPEEYWVVTGYFKTQKGEEYVGILDKKIASEKDARKIYDAIKDGSPFVRSVEQKEVSVNPYPPFTTLPMCAAASAVLGMSTSMTMKTAQSLYESGLITYMRTDSSHIASEAVDQVRSHISNAYEPRYLNSSVRTYRGKQGAQEGHECCRPTDIDNVNPGLGGQEKRLYDLIWRRTVASQMSNGIDRRTKIKTDANKHLFVSNGVVPVFDGFRKVWHFGRAADKILPDVSKNEKCSWSSCPQSVIGKIEKKFIHEPDYSGLLAEQKFTSPPPRFGTPSLLKKLEDLQIARPATVGSFIELLKKRNYFEEKNKIFHPTELGMRVVDFLVSADMCFIDVEFTKHMEDLLDGIASGSTSKTQVLEEFWARLKQGIEKGKEVRQKASETDHKCPKCETGNLLLKHSRFGRFYSCSNYSNKEGKKCEYKADVGEAGEPVEKASNTPAVEAEFKCSKCGKSVYRRKSQYGEFWGCSGYPSCKTIFDDNGDVISTKKSSKKTSRKYKKRK